MIYVAWASIVIGLTIIITTVIGVVHEHREARTDSGDPGPGDGAGLPAGWTGTITGGSGYGPALTDDTSTIDTGEGTGLEPIRAWKQARVHLRPDGGVTFIPTVSGHPSYGVVATAECPHHDQHVDHRAPDTGCTCGFYALDRRPQRGSSDASLVTLEVELYGRVIVGEHGYRAEKQRVLSITATPLCQWPTAAIGLDVSSKRGVPSSLAIYWNKPLSLHTTGTSQGCDRPARWITSRGLTVCAWHAIAQPWRFQEWAPEIPVCETEWRWA